MANRSDTFGRLLKAGISSIAHCEGKQAPVVEEDLGQQIGVSGDTIQRYKAGNIPPDPRAIAILAESCVRRGYLNREWLLAFLRAGRYASPEQLADQLCPPNAPRPRPPRSYQNLPAPTYSQFVMRRQAYDEVLDGLRQRSAVVLIASLGGMGKTSLAREVAARCLADGGDADRFDAIVWISDKDRPGTTTLSGVLDEIARTLDYPGFTQFAHDEKRREVEQLLRRQRVLVVVDNFETVGDGALLDWLLRLPEPSKALVTTREYRREFRRSCWPVELRGMTEAEAQELIGLRLRLLKLDRLVAGPAQLAPLIDATGGNPKAIELALGLAKYARRPLQQVVDDLYAARGELFDDLFARAWALLDEAARRVLLVMTFFPTSARGEALSTAANVRGLPLEPALELLIDLALVDVQQPDLNSMPRYALHPLVRAFAGARLAEQPAFEAGARERWVRWCCELAAQVGFCWDDLRRLDRLDPEHETIHAALTWAFERGRYADTIALVEGVRYFYNVRGLWDDRLAINLMRAEAARQLGDRDNEALALAHHVEIHSKQAMLGEAGRYLARLDEVARDHQFPGDVAFEIEHARALYARACGDLAAAERIWRRLLELSSRLDGQKYVVNRRWLATCLYQQGQADEAWRLYRESLADAIRVNDLRSVTGNTIKLASIALDQGDLAAAAATLAECRAAAEQHQDRRRLAEISRLSARLHAARGDMAAAREDLTTAADLFERMGMRQELEETRAELRLL